MDKDYLQAANATECVILLHGLSRSSRSFKKMASALDKQGCQVSNDNYPSRYFAIEFLAKSVIEKAINHCQEKYLPRKIHFVTHSMGGILLRYYLSENTIDRLGRVVMLSPPNQGTHLVDKLRNMPGFSFISGYPSLQLGTDEKSIPLQLGPANFELGIITGNRSINPINSMLISQPNDGKVAVENAKLNGMSDFLVVPHSHPFIMNSKTVIEQTIHFLQHGYFKKASAKPDDS